MDKLSKSDSEVKSDLALDSQSTRSSISLALHISALIATLAALASINSVLGVDQLAFTSIVLVLIGSVVSFVCRWFRVPERLLNYLALLVVGYFAYCFTVGSISIGDLIPQSQNEGDLQMAVILMWVSVIYSFTLVNDRKIVLSSILSVSIIGLAAANDVNIDLVVYFLIYVVATIFLLVHQNYILHRSWGRASDSSPTSWRLLSTQLGLSAACGALVMIGGLILVVPLQAVGSHLSLGSAFKGLIDFGHGNNDSTDSTVDTGNYADTSTFSVGTGSGFSSSDEVVMHVYPSDRQMHYWRGRTYDQYTGSGWVSSLAQSETDLVPTLTGDKNYPRQFTLQQTEADVLPVQTSFTSTLTTRMEMVGGGTETLYTPEFPNTISLSPTFRAKAFYSQDGGIGIQPEAGLFSYKVTSLDVEASPTDLRKTTTESVPPDIRQMYQFSSSIAPDDEGRLRDTASKIVDALPTSRQDPFDRAEAIRTWVSRRAQYNLNVSAVPNGQDAVSYFLFSSREGYCDLFASSMAVLCRYAGLPSRVVTGFAPGEQRPDGGFDLRAKDKHAWCEVYLAGYGWYLFDPTVGVDVAEDNHKAQTLANFWPLLTTRIKTFLATAGPVPVILMLVVATCLCYAIKTEIFDKRKKPRKARSTVPATSTADSSALEIALARDSADQRWTDVRQALAKWDLRQLPSETTLEFVSRAERVFGSICAVAAQDSRVTIPDLAASKSAVRSLAESFLLTQYSSEDDPVTLLVARERDGSGERDLKTLEDFVTWGRRYASQVEMANLGLLAHDSSSLATR